MNKYDISGMSCAACSSRVESAVSKVEGVTACTVSLLTNSMTVEGGAKEEDIILAVTKAGYGIKTANNKKEKIETSETKILLKRLILSLIFLLPLMYITMGHVMWQFPLPFISGNFGAIFITQMVLALIVILINRKFFINGFKGIIHLSPNMDALVAIGSGASFIFSIASAFNGDLHNLYFESSAMILTLITVGKMLEAYSKGKTTDALKSLMELQPKTATVLRDDKEVIIPAEDVLLDDIFIVRPGESFAVDGIIINGHGAVDESIITGESIPVDKTVNDTVKSATINRSGYFLVKATKVGDDTTLSQIIKIVSDAVSTKAPIAKVADKVSGIFVPAVMAISAITFIIWLLLGESIGFSISRAVAVLVISCPCALGLATPVAIMVGSGLSAKNGILFKTAVSLENTGKVKTVALDKTGTITKGEPEVTDIIGDNLLSLAYALEKKSEHPIAKAIVKKAEEENIVLLETDNFEIFGGFGLSAIIDNEVIRGGNKDFILKYATIPQKDLSVADEFSKKGKTPVFFAKDNKFIGIIAVADTIKEDSKDAIATIKNMGIDVCMLTGDNPVTASYIAKQVGIDKVISSLKPDEKEKEIRKLNKPVIMVGDGINDAPSLISADVGIAIGKGTNLAIESADVVLINSNLTDVKNAIVLSQRTLKIIHENLFWAFFYNAICIPVAAGAFAWAGITLSPMLGALAMSLSSFCVVSNALRLNLFKIKKEKEVKIMTKTVVIKGMMCPHCEAMVKKLLESIDGVTEATASHKEGTAIIKSTVPIDDEIIKKLITDNGYEVV